MDSPRDRMSPGDRAVARLLAERVRRVLGSRLARVVVYGSRARGDAESDSDMDVAVIVDHRTPEVEKLVDDVVYDLVWERDFDPILSVHVFGEEEFNHGLELGFSYYTAVKEGGVPV